MSERQKKTANVSAALERSIIRNKGYRELLERGAKINEAIQNEDAGKNLQEIADIINESDAITSDLMKGPIKTAAENVMDVTVIKMATDLVDEVVSNMDHNQFDEDLFANAILTEINREDNQNNWDLFLPLIMHLDHSTHLSQTMLGTQLPESQPKPKKERVVRQKAQVVQMKKPENVNKLEQNEKGAQVLQAVLNSVVEMYNNTGAPIPYYDLVIDPNDYMATVDNAFQISFLARDGVLAVYNDEQGNLVVNVVSEQEKQAAKKITKTYQAVMTISVEKWMELVEKLGRKEPLLKVNRDILVVNAANDSEAEDSSD